MKLEFNLDRFNSVLDKCVDEAGAECKANPEMTLAQATALTAQFQNALLTEEFLAVVKNIQMGFTFLPADSVALLLAAGYQMGLDDSKASGEVSELNKLFNLGEKNG